VLFRHIRLDLRENGICCIVEVLVEMVINFRGGWSFIWLFEVVCVGILHDIGFYVFVIITMGLIIRMIVAVVFVIFCLLWWTFIVVCFWLLWCIDSIFGAFSPSMWCWLWATSLVIFSITMGLFGMVVVVVVIGHASMMRSLLQMR